MKNFEFLKDFDSDMYALLSEFEREAVKNPKITESYVTPFLEKVVNDILQRNNNAIDGNISANVTINMMVAAKLQLW